ncbi:hypothetical protein EYF80_019114 [Liparis tanakae]|uniref:Uncharacterized protein n=1 Tax=Liparis tanakae TaxID=230148 RepID=A0A4Z2HY82_9TELE|nr:hypothetical protein EYF80_019114 [Liparis tanakae]
MTRSARLRAAPSARLCSVSSDSTAATSPTTSCAVTRCIATHRERSWTQRQAASGIRSLAAYNYSVAVRNLDFETSANKSKTHEDRGANRALVEKNLDCTVLSIELRIVRILTSDAEEAALDLRERREDLPDIGTGEQEDVDGLLTWPPLLATLTPLWSLGSQRRALSSLLSEREGTLGTGRVCVRQRLGCSGSGCSAAGGRSSRLCFLWWWCRWVGLDDLQRSFTARSASPFGSGGEGGMAQGSPGTDIALSRPEGLLVFAVALECSRTVVMLMLGLLLMVTSPAFCCAFRQVAAQPDVCRTVMLGDQSSRREHGEAGVPEHIVGDEGAQLAQHPPGPRTPPDIKNQRGALGGAAVGRRLVVDALKLGKKGGEALLQQLHVVSLYFSGEEGSRRLSPALVHRKHSADWQKAKPFCSSSIDPFFPLPLPRQSELMKPPTTPPIRLGPARYRPRRGLEPCSRPTL